MAAEKRGSIAFFTTYRPPVPLDLYACPVDLPPKSIDDEIHLTDGDTSNYNYNGQMIPPEALKIILRRPTLVSKGIFKDDDVDLGNLSGFVFVSERGEIQLETLHIALRFNNKTETKVSVFSLAEVYGTSAFDGVRMEDSGCIAGDYLVYVTTKDDPHKRRHPWTAVYKTNLKTGETERLTPQGEADLNPSVSPSGKMIAVASFQGKDPAWNGEIKSLKTDIYVINVDRPTDRKLVVADAGWPTWGSDNVIFFHRADADGEVCKVFRADISKPTVEPVCITPENIYRAMTPAAINDTTVAVATVRKRSEFSDVREEDQYRHIEKFTYSTNGELKFMKITQNITPKADHYNPFVIDVISKNKRIGYHRCQKSDGGIEEKLHRLESPNPDVGLFRASGVFPTFSKDGSKLAFVDNEFKSIWLADSEGLRRIYKTKSNSLFSPVWNQDPEKNTLYVCVGPAFSPNRELQIDAIIDVGSCNQQHTRLTKGKFNNAFPSTSPDGNKLVFRSTRDGGDKKNKNLYIMDAQFGEFGDGYQVKRLTDGEWTDTHCQWSPNGDWIVFSSSRDKPTDAPEEDNGLDPGYFAVYLVNPNKPEVVIRVLRSGDNLAGHVNHPCFSPDGKSIVVSADLAAVSVDPISLPLFTHSVRPYGDIFVIDIDQEDINKNEDVKNFTRVTHSRFENSTPTWTCLSTEEVNSKWYLQFADMFQAYTSECPYAYPDGGESWLMTGHLCIPNRRC